MTFLDMKQQVFDRTGQDQSPPAPVIRRIAAYLNRWNRKILSSNGMDPLRRVIVSQSSVANQPTYGVTLQAIRFVTEATNQRRLRIKTLDWYRTVMPDTAMWTGTPDWYVPMGFARIHDRPTAPCQLFAVSTSAADTTQVIKAEVVRSLGYRASLSVTLTGQAPVSLGATITDVVDVEDLYLSAVAAGTVTLTQGSGGTELSMIPIGQTTPRFLRYALAPTPSAVISYQLDGIADIADLVSDTDEPFPNPDFHDLLVDGAVYDEWLMRGRGQDAKSLRADIELRLRRLRCAILEWGDDCDDPYHRTFDETIHEPIV